MIVDRDPGDECDADSYVARTVTIIREGIRRALERATDRLRREAEPGIYVRDRVMLAPYIEITGIIGIGSEHDPGDEDPRMTIRMRPARLVEIVSGSPQLIHSAPASARR